MNMKTPQWLSTPEILLTLTPFVAACIFALYGNTINFLRCIVVGHTLWIFFLQRKLLDNIWETWDLRCNVREMRTRWLDSLFKEEREKK